MKQRKHRRHFYLMQALNQALAQLNNFVTEFLQEAQRNLFMMFKADERNVTLIFKLQ